MRSDTAKSPASSAVHRRLELVGLDLGEVAELADVHAEDRHRRRVHEVDRVQHRAVATERDHEVETGRELVVVHAELGEPDHLRLRLRHAHVHAPLREPRRGRRARARARARGRGAERARPRVVGLGSCRHSVRVGDDAGDRGRRRDPPDRGARARRTRCCRRRRATATSRAHRTPRPRPPSASTTSRSTASCTDGVAHDAALAEPGAARFELRLHQQHELGVRRGEREQARRDRYATR